MEDVQIKVSAAMFRAVSQCQSKEETRYYLNGVNVQPHPEKGALLVATDGHRLLAAHDVDGICTKSAIVALPPVAFEPLRKSPDAALTMTDDGIVTIGFFRSEKPATIDGTFPDWPRVLSSILKSAKATPPVFGMASFNGDYLASFARIAKLLSPSSSAATIRPVIYNDSDPALILFPNAEHAFGVQMPMRGGEHMNGGLPAFMQPIMEPPAPKPAEPVQETTSQPVARKKPAARKKLVKRAVARKPAKKAKRRAA